MILDEAGEIVSVFDHDRPSHEAIGIEYGV
jgi:hypothetical protein